MAQDYRIQWELVKLWHGQYADFFLERSVPKGSENFDDYAILSFVPREDLPRVDVHLPVEQLRRLADFLDGYCREMEGRPPATAGGPGGGSACPTVGPS